MENWYEEFHGAITICDINGMITYMNKTSLAQMAKYGGADLIGKSLLDCHNQKSQAQIIEMLKVPQNNSYVIEKRGVKKLIHQAPIFENGNHCGLIEITIVLPQELPHFIRD